MAQALRLFAAYDVTAEIAVLDTGMHPPHLLKEFRESQAAKIAAGGTPQHHPSLVAELWADADRWRKLSDPSTMQIFTTIAAVEAVIREMEIYYVLREPRELGLFRWTLDAKETGAPTNAEDLWKKLVCPFLQGLFLQEPVAGLEGGDYSHYERSYRSKSTELPDYLRPHLKQGYDPNTDSITNLRKLMLGDLAFESSEAHAGLQVADIIGSAMTRAVNRSLGIKGWERLGRLLINRTGSPVRFLALGPGIEGRQQRELPLRPPVSAVISRLLQSAKSRFPHGS